MARDDYLFASHGPIDKAGQAGLRRRHTVCGHRWPRIMDIYTRIHDERRGGARLGSVSV